MQAALCRLDCLLPLSEHLSVAEIFRLYRALGHSRHCMQVPELVQMLASRLSLVRAIDYLRTISRHMHTKTRCSECGESTHRRCRVCQRCADDPQCLLAMVSRRQVRVAYRFLSKQRVEGVIRTLRVAATSRMGAFYYWKRDVQAALGIPPDWPLRAA